MEVFFSVDHEQEYTVKFYALFNHWSRPLPFIIGKQLLVEPIWTPASFTQYVPRQRPRPPRPRPPSAPGDARRRPPGSRPRPAALVPYVVAEEHCDEVLGNASGDENEVSKPEAEEVV